MWRKGNPRALLVGMQTGAATAGNSTEFPQKKPRDGPAFCPGKIRFFFKDHECLADRQ